MKSDSGNAVVEFVAIGLIAQLLVIGFLLRVGSDFRSEMAASSIARQTLRTLQLSGQQGEALSMGNQVRELFGIPDTSASIQIQESCQSQGSITTTVEVRGKRHVSTGFCLDR